MLLNKHISDIAVIADPMRHSGKPFTCPMVFMLGIIFGLYMIDSLLQLVNGCRSLGYTSFPRVFCDTTVEYIQSFLESLVSLGQLFAKWLVHVTTENSSQDRAASILITVSNLIPFMCRLHCVVYTCHKNVEH
jgi:type IV secretory pathway VirB6-like protein